MKLKKTLQNNNLIGFLKRGWRRRLGIRLVIYMTAIPLAAYLLLLSVLLLNPITTEDLQGFPESRRILDCRGQLLREVVNRDGARAKWVDLKDISPLVIDATLAVEDSRFYSHSGVDWFSAARAIRQFVTSGRPRSGASTITMQLARLLFHHPHNFWGKFPQVYDALRLERALSKDDILTQYLNRAYYGAGAVGIEAASRRYFGKPGLHLSLAEAALLAGLLKAPSDLNPAQSLESAKKRQHFVLKRMLDTGRIDIKEFERACWEPLNIKGHPPGLAAMHFTDYVLSLNPPPGDVKTTLDSDLQEQIEQLVAHHVKSLESGGLTNAAVVVLDNKDGSILAMVGSADYWGEEGGCVNGAIARRQPGSALKPFTYALAFEKGFTPASVVADIETRYLGSRGTLFSPKNYSEKLYGPVLMKEALGRSLNVPAVRVANAVGINDLLMRLRAAGFASLDKDAGYYGLGLTLGNGEVTLLELAQGYAMFARDGIPCQAQTIVNRDMDCSAPEMKNSTRIFSETTCFLITDILSDERLRIRAFGAANPLLLDFPMAIKTGTSSNWRDNWVAGYTKRYTIAVWTGDFKGSPMNQVYGAIGAGPLFHKIANLVVRRSAVPEIPTRPEPPLGVEQIVVCALSGMAPTEHCPNCCTLYVSKTGKPHTQCRTHRLMRIDKRNGLLASNRCPARYVEKKVFEILPAIYTEWQAGHKRERPPTRYSPFCPPGGITADALVITSPRKGEIYLMEPGYDRRTQSLRFSGEVDPLLPEVTWLVDGRDVGTAQWPYETDWPMAKGRHTLEMVGGGKRSDPISFEVR
ncbi:penicillin-binding protein 1C [Acidobacteriota bacterium]